MRVEKTPVARMLILFSWLIPVFFLAAVAAWFYFKSDIFPALVIFALFAAGVLLAVAVRMFANIGQNAFEAVNILQYQYKENSVYFKSLLSNLEVLSKEVAALRKESSVDHNAFLPILETLSKNNLSICGSLDNMRKDGLQFLEITQAQLRECVIELKKASLLLSEAPVSVKEISANILFAQEKIIQSVNTLSAQVRSLSEETLVIRSNSEQLACDTRDISGFFAQIEKHLLMKPQA